MPMSHAEGRRRPCPIQRASTIAYKKLVLARPRVLMELFLAMRHGTLMKKIEQPAVRNASAAEVTQEMITEGLAQADALVLLRTKLMPTRPWAFMKLAYSKLVLTRPWA